MNVTLDAIWNGYAQLKKKDVILRVVTEVTPDIRLYFNISNAMDPK
jgi:hypothetical protein